MNQPTSSCSMDAFIIPPDQDEKNSKKKHVYSKEFQAILDGLEEEDRLLEEYGTQANDHKKKRLSTVQVKALEKIFEVENKVESERKVQLAEELGLQPKQVAVWFQNRRARSKNKQLEKDYAVLKASYDDLKFHHDNLEHENHALTEKLRELKEKQSKDDELCGNDDDGDDDGDGDGSFGIVKEEISNMNGGLLMSSSPASCSFQLNGSSSSTDSSNHQWGKMYEPQLVKVEEQCMFSSAEECCNFFSVDQPPTLQWQFTGQ